MRKLILGLILSTLVVAPALACGPRPANNPAAQTNIPPLGASLDDTISEAKPSPADAAKVKELRAKMTKLAAIGKQDAARDAEAEAMRILGYEKAYMRCGPGTFMWRKTLS